MKAALWYKSGDIRIEDIPEPSPCAGEVKIKVKWCGICGSDLHEFTMVQYSYRWKIPIL